MGGQITTVELLLPEAAALSCDHQGNVLVRTGALDHWEGRGDVQALHQEGNVVREWLHNICKTNLLSRHILTII